MIPYLLAVVGGYLIGDSMKDSQTFADGGMMAHGGIPVDQGYPTKEGDYFLMDKKRELKTAAKHDGVESYSLELQMTDGEIDSKDLGTDREKAIKAFDKTLNDKNIYHQFLYVNYNDGDSRILKEAKNGFGGRGVRYKDGDAS